MTLHKAIEILSDSAYRGSTTFNEDFKDAQKLGIEALKKWKILREGKAGTIDPLLPGETYDLSSIY